MEKLKIGDYVGQNIISSIKGRIIEIKKDKATLEIERGTISGVPLKTLELIPNNELEKNKRMS